MRKRGFLQRLLKFFSVEVAPAKVTHTKNVEVKSISFIVDKETGQRTTLDDLPPEARAKLANVTTLGQSRLLFPDEIPPELKVKLKDAVASGQARLLTLDEIPADLRAKVEEAIASGQALTKQVFSYQGPDGRTHTCHSLEELPNDVRAKFQEAIASNPGGEGEEVFSYQGPDGQKHIFHSLEEMPEHIQAIFRIASEVPPQR